MRAQILLFHKKHIILFFLIVFCIILMGIRVSLFATKDKTLYIGTVNQPKPIDPIHTTSTISASLMDLIFNDLVRVNSKGEFEPDLAESWDVSDDGLIWTFYLRKGVRFHKNRELTSEDVYFTYTAKANVESKYRYYFAMVERWEVVDRYTIRAILKEPYAPFLYELQQEIVPADIWKENPNFGKEPIGTGPYRFVSWDKDDRIALEANPDYFEGSPRIEKVVINRYSSMLVMWGAFMRGEIDLAEFIGAKEFEIAKTSPSIKTFALRVDLYYAIIFNLSDPLLEDIKVREALSCAINRQEIIGEVIGGHGILSKGPFAPGFWAADTEVDVPKYNPHKAVELLKQAGWKDANDNGILDKNGKELRIRIVTDRRKERNKHILMLIHQQFYEIGVDLEIVFYNKGVIEFKKQNKRLENIQGYLDGFIAGGIDPDIALNIWYSKSERADKLWNYENEEVDELIEEGRLIRDKEKRKEIYQRVHKLIIEDIPAVFLFSKYDFHAVSQRIKGAEEYFVPDMPFYTVKDWEIE